MAFVCDVEYDKIIYYISGKKRKEILIPRNDEESHTQNIRKFMCEKVQSAKVQSEKKIKRSI